MKQTGKRAWIILIIVQIVILACATGAGPSSQILFQDNFSDPNSGWDTLRTTEGITDYENGGYRILLNLQNADVWANPRVPNLPRDLQIEVDVTKVAGPDDNDYGVICRYQNNQNFYFFVISSDGYLGIGKVKDGSRQLINRAEMPPSEVIKQGNATNHLRADCNGDTLSLYVNDELVDSQLDSEYGAGDVGLMAGSFQEGGVDILFTNFVVKKVSP